MPNVCFLHAKKNSAGPAISQMIYDYWRMRNAAWLKLTMACPFQGAIGRTSRCFSAPGRRTKGCAAHTCSA